MSRFLLKIMLCLCVLLASSSLPWGLATEAKRIGVLISTKAGPYEDMLAGFEESLRQHGIDVSLHAYLLESDSTTASQALAAMRQTQTDLIFTLGTFATQQALKAEGSRPIVAGLIVKPEILAGATHASGVVLEFPVELQLQWLRRFLPTAKNVGVLYNPAENQQRIEAAQAVARTLGLRLEARAVPTVRALPVALDSLGSGVDVIWGMIDDVVLTPQTAKNILLFSFQQRIPFVGPSTTWVKAGALYALEWDYVDLGRQCGSLALKMFQGVPVSPMPPETPRTVLYTLNQKTARHMKLEIAEFLIRGAHELF